MRLYVYFWIEKSIFFEGQVDHQSFHFIRRGIIEVVAELLL